MTERVALIFVVSPKKSPLDFAMDLELRSLSQLAKLLGDAVPLRFMYDNASYDEKGSGVAGTGFWRCPALINEAEVHALMGADTPAKPQAERFKEVARALGCDEDEAAFKAKLAVIARQKPKDEPAPRPKVKES